MTNISRPNISVHYKIGKIREAKNYYEPEKKKDDELDVGIISSDNREKSIDPRLQKREEPDKILAERQKKEQEPDEKYRAHKNSKINLHAYI